MCAFFPFGFASVQTNISLSRFLCIVGCWKSSMCQCWIRSTCGGSAVLNSFFRWQCWIPSTCDGILLSFSAKKCSFGFLQCVAEFDFSSWILVSYVLSFFGIMWWCQIWVTKTSCFFFKITFLCEFGSFKRVPKLRFSSWIFLALYVFVLCLGLWMMSDWGHENEVLFLYRDYYLSLRGSA